MKTPPPSDLVQEFPRTTRLTARERRRLVTMRRQNGAIEIKITVHARPAGEGAWQPLRSANKVYRAHSALNAEQIIFSGPIAGRHFTATTALLEFYEQQTTKGETPE